MNFSFEDHMQLKDVTLRVINTLEALNFVEESPASEQLLIKMIHQQDEMIQDTFDLIDKILDDPDRDKRDVQFAIEQLSSLCLLYLGAEEGLSIILGIMGVSEDQFREEAYKEDNDKDN